MAAARFEMTPIGFVSSPYKQPAHVPKGLGAKHEAEGILEINSDLELGLTDIEGFSHLFVLWIFDRTDGFQLFGTPPSDNQHTASSQRGRRGVPIRLG